jgi:hypothetical protein
MPSPHLSEVRALPSQLVDAVTTTDGSLSATGFLSAMDINGTWRGAAVHRRRLAESVC